MTALHALAERTVYFEGSTRPVALMRIGLALVAWSRYALELALFTHQSPAYFVLGLSFFGASSAMLAGFYSRLATAWTGGRTVTRAASAASASAGTFSNSVVTTEQVRASSSSAAGSA